MEAMTLAVSVPSMPEFNMYLRLYSKNSTISYIHMNKIPVIM